MALPHPARCGAAHPVLDADYAFVDGVVFVDNDGRSCPALGYPLQ